MCYSKSHLHLGLMFSFWWEFFKADEIKHIVSWSYEALSYIFILYYY